MSDSVSKYYDIIAEQHCKVGNTYPVIITTSTDESIGR